MGKSKIEPTSLDREVVKALTAAKAESNVSIRELERISGVSRMRVQRTLDGTFPIYLNELDALCEALGLVSWRVLRDARMNLRKGQERNQT